MALVIGAIALLLSNSLALAQPPAASATPTAAPRNLSWCPGVPATPPPPKFSAAEWADISKDCSDKRAWPREPTKRFLKGKECASLCRGAQEMWQRWKEGDFNQTPSWPTSTDRPQGPIPLQGGGKGYVLPLPPTPAPSATPSALLAPTDPPGPFFSFNGPDVNAEIGQPPASNWPPPSPSTAKAQ